MQLDLRRAAAGARCRSFWYRFCATLLLGHLLLAGWPTVGHAQQTPPPEAPPAAAAPAATPGQAAEGGTAPAASPRAQPGGAAEPPPPLATDPLYPAELVSKSEALTAEVRRLHKAVERVRNSDEDLAAQRIEVEKLAAEALSIEEALAAPLAAVSTQITRLGAKPKAGEPAEPPNIQRERQRLERIKTQIQGAIKTANLAGLRARQLTGQIQDLRLTNFARNLFERRTSPVSPILWSKIWTYAPRIGSQLTTITSNWWAVAQPRVGWLILSLLAAFAIYLMLRLVREWSMRKLLTEPQTPRPTFFRRAYLALWLAPLIALPGLGAVSFIFAAFELAGLMNTQVRPLLLSAWIGFALYLSVDGLARVILLPQYPSWRLVGVSNDVSQRVLSLARALVAVYAIDLFLGQVIRQFYFPAELGIAVTSLANVVFALLLAAVALLKLPDAPERPSERIVKSALFWLKFPALAIAALIVLSTLFGYVALGRFLAGQVLLVACGSVAVLVCHLAIRALSRRAADHGEAETRVFGLPVKMTASRAQQIAGAISLLLNTLLILGAGALLLLSWGFSEALLLGWLKSLVFGFEVGQFRISLFKILVALGLFVLVMFLTRVVQRWLSSRVLTESRVDPGIANSVHQGIGYAGMALAALVAISHVGLDITNLAIVAGALSVGIGFGLQSIVNNFVSGLILLVERPVKVGDWIVVGANQGHVRRISVRATEIETFDRASVIIPNSELITGTVQNWTHRNAMGRVVINVGASYNADPQHVCDVLVRVARECDLLLRFPEPFVAFEEFGASSLDFSLRGYVADVNTSLSAKTALRMAIHRAFKEEGIEIPYPQTDVHMRDLDGLRSALQRVAAERLRTTGGAPAPASQNPTAADVPASDAVSPGDVSATEDGGGEGEGGR